jgi:hypothetical protein
LSGIAIVKNYHAMKNSSSSTIDIGQQTTLGNGQFLVAAINRTGPRVSGNGKLLIAAINRQSAEAQRGNNSVKPDHFDQPQKPAKDSNKGATTDSDYHLRNVIMDNARNEKVQLASREVYLKSNSLTGKKHHQQLSADVLDPPTPLKRLDTKQLRYQEKMLKTSMEGLESSVDTIPRHRMRKWVECPTLLNTKFDYLIGDKMESFKIQDETEAEDSDCDSVNSETLKMAFFSVVHSLRSKKAHREGPVTDI